MTSKGFFALDIHQFEQIAKCGLGVEEAATYLCILTGTNKGNVTSVWGVNSVMQNAGLSRAETKQAIENLKRHGLMEAIEVPQSRVRAKSVPRFKLPTYEQRLHLSAKENLVIEAIGKKQFPVNPEDINAAHRAKAKGWLGREADVWTTIPHTNDVAFIPNSFVKADHGHSPLHRLVNNGELEPFMLAAELYQRQDLMDERGVPLSLVRGYWRATNTDLIGRHKLHHLEPGRLYENTKTGKPGNMTHAHNHNWRTPDFWKNLEALDGAHVIEWAVYSANGKPPTSNEYSFNRPQRPLGVLRDGNQVWDTPEALPGFLTHLAHLNHEGTIGPETNLQIDDLVSNWQANSPVIALENTSVGHVEGVGILRMVHRAETENYKVWYRDLCAECEVAVFFAKGALQSHLPQISDITANIRCSSIS